MAAGFSVTILWKLIGLPFGIGATVPGAIACLLALVIAVVCYAVLVVLLRCITYQDCLLLPKGEKIAKLLHLREKT